MVNIGTVIEFLGRMNCGVLVLAIALVVNVGRIEADSRPQADRNAAAAIDLAIAEGMRREVEPYALRGVHDQRLVGWIYTPHVRVARFARAASLKGVNVGPTDIPSEIADQFIMHVVMHNVANVASADGLGSVRLAAIRRPRTVPPPPTQPVYFVPVPRRLVHAEGIVGLERASFLLSWTPNSGNVLVGAFPAAFAKEPFPEFCVYREYTDASGGPAQSVSAGYAEGPLR